MQDRHTPFLGVPGDFFAEPYAYCAAGAGEIVAADQWPPERLAHLYRCRGLSTYRIAELTGLDRQRVTRALHRAGVRCGPARQAVSGRCGARMTGRAFRSS